MVEEACIEVGVLDLVAVEEAVYLLADAFAGLGIAVVHVDGAHEVVDVIGICEAGQGLLGGQDVDGLDELGRALRGGIEEADGVDLIAPEVDAGGKLRADGVDIEDASSPSCRARQVDGRLEGVSHAPPLVEELAEIEGLSGNELVQALLESLAGDGLLGDRRGRCDDDVRVGAGIVVRRVVCEESREHADALLLGVGVGDEALEGEGLALGEVENGALVGAPEGDLLIEPSGLVGSGHNEENGDIDVPREGGEGHRHAVGQHLQADVGAGLPHRTAEPVEFRRALQDVAQYAQGHFDA